MSSLLRRIERQGSPSRAVHWDKVAEAYVANPPRGIFFNERGSKLGVVNVRAKDLLARKARERRRATIKVASK